MYLLGTPCHVLHGFFPCLCHAWRALSPRGERYPPASEKVVPLSGPKSVRDSLIYGFHHFADSSSRTTGNTFSLSGVAREVYGPAMNTDTVEAKRITRGSIAELLYEHGREVRPPNRGGRGVDEA